MNQIDVLVAIYVGIGGILSSGLHTLYTWPYYNYKRFGPLLYEEYGIRVRIPLAFLAAPLTGLLLGTGAWVLVLLFVPDPIRFSPDVSAWVVEFLLGSGVLVLLSSVVGGPGLFRLFLDSMLLLTSLLVILTFVAPPTVFQLVLSTIVGLGGVLMTAFAVWLQVWIIGDLHEQLDIGSVGEKMERSGGPWVVTGAFVFFLGMASYMMIGFVWLVLHFGNVR